MPPTNVMFCLISLLSPNISNRAVICAYIIRRADRDSISYVPYQKCAARLVPSSPLNFLSHCRTLHFKQLLPLIIILPGSMAGESGSRNRQERGMHRIHWLSSECVPSFFCFSHQFMFSLLQFLCSIHWIHGKKTHMETGAAAAQLNSLAAFALSSHSLVRHESMRAHISLLAEDV